METRVYEAVTIPNEDVQKFAWKPFLRQILICSGVWMTFFLYGLAVGAPTVFIPQIRKEANSTEAVSDEMASWLSSIYGYAGLPWVPILSILAQKFGRKRVFLFVCLDSFLGFVVFYCSQTVVQILISEIMVGMVSISTLTIDILILTEYTSPRYRGIFCCLQQAVFFWGIWISNAIGTFLPWKNIGIFALLCSSFYLTVFLWPESPYWLARNGRFKECAAAHRWLKGTDEESEKELENLIKTQKQYRDDILKNEVNIKQDIISFLRAIKTKAMYKPVLLSIVLLGLYYFSGKLVCTVYAIDILKKITNNERAAYIGMLVLDAITIVGMYIGCALSRYLKRRTLLLAATVMSISFLFTLSIYLYLVKLLVISDNTYVSILLLTLYSICTCGGPLLLASTISGELTPLMFRSTCVFILTMSAKITMSSVLKISPYLFKSFGMHGTFLFFGITSSIFLFILYKYLPETKGKTLHEIGDNIKGKIVNDETTDLMNGHEKIDKN